MSGHYTLEDLMAAERAGQANPDHALIERLAEVRAYELIHERSVEMLGLARRSAAEKGSNWSQMIEEQAAQEWEADRG